MYLAAVIHDSLAYFDMQKLLSTVPQNQQQNQNQSTSQQQDN